MGTLGDKHSVLRRITVVAITAIVYYVSARIGLLLNLSGTNVSPVWPPTGAAFAILLVAGVHAWPGILIGAFAANFLTGLSLAVSTGISAGNTIEAVSAFLLVRRLASHRNPVNEIKDFSAFLLVAITCTMISATIGTSCILLGGFGHGASFLYLWWTWWLGDTVGALVVTPLVLAWSERTDSQWTSRKTLEAAALVIALIGLGLWVFSGWYSTGQTELYITVPLIVLASFRFQQRGAATGILVLSIISIWGTLNGHGPFQRESLNESLLLLQVFIGVVSITSLSLAAVIRENERLYLESRKRLVEKEVLIGEIHHRVKNNLQVICSLLNLQTHNVDSSTRAILTENMNRIQTMALIHKKLYQTENSAEVDLGLYIKELGEMLLDCYPSETIREFNADCESFSLHLDKAIPCGLILNEIMTNALKHAFSVTPTGEIKTVCRLKENRVYIDVTDNGSGLPSDFDLKKQQSFGFHLMQLLVRQLGGELHVASDNGTHIHLEFDR